MSKSSNIHVKLHDSGWRSLTPAERAFCGLDDNGRAIGQVAVDLPTLHSPAPWYADGLLVRDDHGGRVAEIARSQEELADARLIAASPTLLAALFELCERCQVLDFGEHPLIEEAVTAGYAALAKAVGWDALPVDPVYGTPSTEREYREHLEATTLAARPT